MENSIRSIMEYVCETLAFEKMTFSKCRDAHILRATVTPFARRGEAYIQPCFYHQSDPQLGIVFALAPSLHLSGVIPPLISSSILGPY